MGVQSRDRCDCSQVSHHNCQYFVSELMLYTADHVLFCWYWPITASSAMSTLGTLKLNTTFIKHEKEPRTLENLSDSFVFCLLCKLWMSQHQHGRHKCHEGRCVKPSVIWDTCYPHDMCRVSPVRPHISLSNTIRSPRESFSCYWWISNTYRVGCKQSTVFALLLLWASASSECFLLDSPKSRLLIWI